MTQGIKGRPPIHLPRIIEYMDEHVSGPGDIIHCRALGYALDLTTEQVSSTISRYIKRAGPDAKIARVKPGVVRWVSPAERQRRKGRARKTRGLVRAVEANILKAAKKIAPEGGVVTVGEAAVNGELTARDGWVAPAMDIPALTVQRGGIKWDPPLTTGESFTARVVHLSRGVDNALDVYFIYGGKMWKAYAI